MHWFRHIRIRWQIREDIHEAFLTLGCTLVCRRRLNVTRRVPAEGAVCRILRSRSGSGRHPITIITHEHPIGRGHANYMIYADLSGRQDGWREQLWTRRLTEDTFEVTCLPFFTYGICYLDVVTIDSNHLVTSVVRKSGHQVLRVALVAERRDRDHLHALLHSKVVEAALRHEWLQSTYLSVDLPPDTDPAALVEALITPARAGVLHWEIDA